MKDKVETNKKKIDESLDKYNTDKFKMNVLTSMINGGSKAGYISFQAAMTLCKSVFNLGKSCKMYLKNVDKLKKKNDKLDPK